MKRGEFIINGQSSLDWDVVIQSRPILEAPKRKIEMKEGYGHDGSIPYDEEAYENTTMTLLCYCNGKIPASDSRAKIMTAMDTGTYTWFRWYGDPLKIYEVLMTGPPKFEGRHYMGEGFAFEVELSVKPWKYLRTQADPVFHSPGAIRNPTKYNALPRIEIQGNGDVMLRVGNQNFDLRGITNHIVIDTAKMFVYKYGDPPQNQNHKAYTRKFPILRPGYSEIKWSGTGTVSRVIIKPNWRELT